MYYRSIFYLLSRVFIGFACMLLIPLSVAIYFDFFEPGHTLFPTTYLSFFYTIVVTLVLALLFSLFGKKEVNVSLRKESILVVVLIWILTSAVGSLPFILSGNIPSPVDAYFETVSGVTTTGASIITPKMYNEQGNEIQRTITKDISQTIDYHFYGTIEPLFHPDTKEIIAEGFGAIPRPILFWRSFLQWIGGLGIILTFITVFPSLAIGGKFLLEAEGSKNYLEELTPRLKDTASRLWKIYLFLTLAEITLLYTTNTKMPLFDSIAVTFSNISTGGFSIHNASIAAYDSSITEWIVIFFMIFGGINFSLYFFIVKRKFSKVLQPELFFFLITAIFASALIIFKLVFEYDNTLTTLIRHGVFQLVSSLTCTGFFTANYDIWPMGAQLVMLFAMYIGGMSGSTSGGIKCSRHIILFNAVKHKIERLFKPEAVRNLTIGKKEVSPSVLSSTFTFFWVIVVMTAIGVFLLTYDGVDLATSFGLIASAINNVGLSFRAAGPESTCAFLPTFSKIVMIIWMFLGRLEFFAILMLFIPSFWKST